MNDNPERVEPQEITLDAACPSCEGALQARITPGRLWTYCAACKRLSQPVVLRAANGAMVLHPSVAA